MNEKRFTLSNFASPSQLSDVCDDGGKMLNSEVVDKLNEQQATINELQSIINHIKCEEDCFDYDYCCETVCSIYNEIKHLKEENEQLRKTIKEVIELLLEEVDLFSDKATEHDIIAYKEMNEFDNKDAYYMCVSTKKAIKMLQRCL